MTIYVPYTTRVSDMVIAATTYGMVDFNIRVDGTGYINVRYTDGRYFDKDFTRAQMQMSDASMAAFIIACVDAYFTGWAVRTGRVVR